jgi:ketosteroid isomerase-like protein
MSASDARRVLGRACALWADGDLPGLLSHFVDDVVFTVHARPHGASLVGEGMSRALFAHRLESLLDHFAVLDFQLQSMTTDGLWHYTRVGYSYRHHASGLVLDGTMRHKWGFVDDKIAHFELYHDAARMRAFLDMAMLVATGS